MNLKNVGKHENFLQIRKNIHELKKVSRISKILSNSYETYKFENVNKPRKCFFINKMLLIFFNLKNVHEYENVDKLEKCSRTQKCLPI